MSSLLPRGLPLIVMPAAGSSNRSVANCPTVSSLLLPGPPLIVMLAVRPSNWLANPFG
ncbi:hypothetical protein [Nocardia sp. NPDC050710]|uniref:hypothetical protein n=1 Tax=Nocardia sp. NPDC050710 TaxID=3157220 RepID=UPI0033EA1687